MENTGKSGTSGKRVWRAVCSESCKHGSEGGSRKSSLYEEKLACFLPYYTPSGVAVTNFSVATSRSWTGQDGQRQEKTVWFRVAAWRRLAETCNQYLTKGQRVLVVGEMEEPTPWTDREGNTRASLEVTAQTVRFLNTR
ncbi:MAG: single-stranded DNA-binding protein, partial [Candidatus Kaiserbacteria bacterium]|nr:single-stranded DNA-binding protein [Candidatus Kaiserbacteria bacterium]